MQVVEKFVSINGEGQRAGEIAVFIRFKGCNLRCSYCDTMWANEPGCAFDEMSPSEISEYINQTGIKNVTLTGGEPLLQKDIAELINLLLEQPSLRVEIETNGAADITALRQRIKEPGRVTFTVDYKLPSSGCEKGMLPANFRNLKPSDTVKFVSGSKADLDRALEIINEFGLTGKCKIYFSPVFGSIEPVEIVNFLIDNNLNDVRLQIQMHKVIWDPDKRGV